MSRKPHQPAELGDTAGPMPTGHAITIASEEETKAIEEEMAFKAAEAIGMLKALEFSEMVSARAKVEVFLNLGKSKAYKAIFITDESGNRKRISDLDEFCDHFFGKSARRMRQQAANYHLLGGDLFEASQRIGFRNQDYTALKALPADDQEVIKQAMQPEVDRDHILDLMQEMAARHASVKAALTTKTKEAEETAASRDTIIKNKQARLDQAEEENVKLKRRVETTTPDEAALEIRKEADRIAFLAEHGVRANLRKAFEVLIQHGDVHQHSEFMLGLITQIEFACDVLRGDFGLLKAGPDGDSTPHWERGPAQGGVN